MCVFIVVCVALSASTVGAATPGEWVGDGRVRFINDAASDFDRFTRSPLAARKRWMRRHYYRQRVYSSYFDTRSRWYRRGWVYRDLYAIYEGSDLAERRPRWILRDRRGRRLYIPFDCDGESCPQYAGDVGNPAFRRYWIDRTRATLRRGTYVGLHVDDVNMELRVGDRDGDQVAPVDPRTGRQMTASTWRRYVAEFTERIRAAFPRREISHNPIWFASEDRSVRRANVAADWINLERGVNDEGLTDGDGRYGFETFLAHVDRLHAQGRHVVFDSYAGRRAPAEYNLAAYLLVNQDDDGIRTQFRHTPRGWWSAAYDLDLGPARGPRYEWRDLLRRDFARGYVLVNQPDRQTITVSTPRTKDLDDFSTPTTTLTGGRGVVRLIR
jgi:hypothetical protein